MEIVLEASHTHLYPGHEGRISGVDAVSRLPAETTCRIDFADGGVAFATLSRADDADGDDLGLDDWALEVGAYTTGAETAIPVKRWRVGIRQEDDGLTFRIRGRLAS